MSFKEITAYNKVVDEIDTKKTGISYKIILETLLHLVRYIVSCLALGSKRVRTTWKIHYKNIREVLLEDNNYLNDEKQQ